MPYQLLYSEPIDGIARDVGENIFLRDLSFEYRVFLFYYPGAMPNEDLENKLRDLGNMTGKNLHVNIGRLNDPDLPRIQKLFNIRNYPVIIMTGISELASPLGESETAYARIDDTTLMDSPEILIQCLQRLFILFSQGEVSKTMNVVKNAGRGARIYRLKRSVNRSLRGIGGFLKGMRVDVSLLTGTFTVRYSGR